MRSLPDTLPIARTSLPGRREPCLRTRSSLALDGLRFWPVSDEKISLEYKLKRFLEGCLLSPERAHVHWNGTFSEPAKAALLRRPLPGAMGNILERLAGSLRAHDGLHPYLEFDQQYYLADDILVKSDRMSMAHAVEVRPPFLDHRIVEFAATLPDTLKMRGSRQKLLLKELMTGQTAAIDSQTQEGRLRYSRARVAPRIASSPSG